jgi:CDP-diacylglycerol pyrophosphatase
MHPRARRAAAVASTLLVCALAAGCRHGDPDALWNIVHGQCIPDQQRNHAPAPCAEVELGEGEGRGYALLKDRNGAYQYLLIPTARLSGIESPELLAPGAPNYFAAAWAARGLVEQKAGHALPRTQVALAINSRYGRSQRQLHIHVDCLRRDVAGALHDHLGEIGQTLAPLGVPLAGRQFRAMRLAGAALAGVNPFGLLAASLPPGEDIGRHTLVLAGVDFEDGTPGFVLLDGRAGVWPFDIGHGEDVQSHQCS